MDKLDFKKRDKGLYSGKSARWDRVMVPTLTYLAVDGEGDPNASGYAVALGVLYPVAYGLKFAFKAKGADFVVPPLEALWWADDPSAFVRGDRAAWRWTVMLRMPEGVDKALLEGARERARDKLVKKGSDISRLDELRLDRLNEGDSLQTLHIGAYTDEAPTLAHLHDELMPAEGLTFNGPHHEIYLSDPRRVAPDKLRTILRQPVKSTG